MNAAPRLRPAPLAPASEEELCAAVAEATAARQPLAPAGSGTKRHLGPAVAPGATPLSLQRLARITAHEPGDLVVSVQAGVRLADLQRTLAERGQWLPVDPPHAEATIGGVLAAASSGPRRLGYGTIKDQLLGLRVVGAGGTVTRSGGRVVKNVSGYDLHKLHVGAFGTLGVILEAHLKVRPRPEVSGAIVFGCETLAAAHRLLLEIWASPLRPVALEALSVAAAGGLRGVASGLPAGQALAIVGVEGSRAVFDRHVRELEGRAGAAAVLRGPACEGLWAAFRDAADRRRDEITVRIGARPHDLPDLLAALGERAGSVTVQAATGLARVHLRPEPEIGPLVRGWHERAAARGGYAAVESAPPELAGRAELPFAGAAQPLFAAVKRQWDPDGLFNPGKAPP